MDAQGGFCNSGLKLCRPEMAQFEGHGQWASVDAYAHVRALETEHEQNMLDVDQEPYEMPFVPYHTPNRPSTADLRRLACDWEFRMCLPLKLEKLNEYAHREELVEFNAELARLDRLWWRLPGLWRGTSCSRLSAKFQPSKHNSRPRTG